jgi:hypothetical protein
MRVLDINAAVLIPTIGRPGLAQLVATVDRDPALSTVVADDRRDATSALDLPATTAPLVVGRTNGRGPAAARNAGLLITADIAYRRSDLLATGGFYQRFPSGFREDADLGLRTVRAGYATMWGERVTTHPLASSPCRDTRVRTCTVPEL